MYFWHLNHWNNLHSLIFRLEYYLNGHSKFLVFFSFFTLLSFLRSHKMCGESDRMTFCWAPRASPAHLGDGRQTHASLWLIPNGDPCLFKGPSPWGSTCFGGARRWDKVSQREVQFVRENTIRKGISQHGFDVRFYIHGIELIGWIRPNRLSVCDSGPFMFCFVKIINLQN